ncbi:ATP-binding protein [Brevundimonas sp. DC300-4]|uniref:hybrid sensor histidine kinase/response regulator n=1 Tax=Brevundimonas sp. DC300-4 TaxID=2804594 RepID=UPI003CF7594E
MIQLPDNEREKRRLAMLASLGLTGGSPDRSLSTLATLAADISDASTGLVTLAASERVYILGSFGMGVDDLDRWDSFCTHVLVDPTPIFWIPDALNDVRFSASRYVVGPPFTRFYAGVPLTVNGCTVGALCVTDPHPKDYDAALARRLIRVGEACVAELIERHRTQAMRQALAASADALVDCDEFGLILSWSAGAETLFGYNRAEALGSDIEIIIPHSHRTGHHEGMKRWRSSGTARLGRRLELPAIRKDGSSLDIELWMSVSHENGAPCLHANIRDISQRREQARNLEAATARAEDASRSKTTFLANMSHELRTPLNGVTAAAGLLVSSGLSTEQQTLVGIISGAADQLSRLIDDLLDLTRIESGELKLDPSTTDLVALVDHVFQLAGLRADEKGIDLTLEMQSGLGGEVVADQARLKQVLGNLLSNALKFTSTGGVKLLVRRKGDRYRFEVRDTGIGFHPHQRETIFERFQQADPTITRRFGGTGLGLAICRDIVEAMGGGMDCASTPGAGSSFWFEIELPACCSVAFASEEETGVNDLTGLRVLVIDDNATNRNVAGLILKAAGLAPEFAENGRDALDAIAAMPFDLLLMDMMMPVMDGLEATRRLRSGEAGSAMRAVPVIMLSANSLPEHVSQSLAAGATAHLAKPITPSLLLESIASAVAASPPQRQGLCG